MDDWSLSTWIFGIEEIKDMEFVGEDGTELSDDW